MPPSDLKTICCLGCTPANNPSNATTLVINATTKNFANIGNIVGSDEVWFNKGDRRYYTASNRNCKTAAPCPTAAQQAAVLGVIDGTSVLIETIPQSSGLALGGGGLQAQPHLRSASGAGRCGRCRR